MIQQPWTSRFFFIIFAAAAITSGENVIIFVKTVLIFNKKSCSHGSPLLMEDQPPRWLILQMFHPQIKELRGNFVWFSQWRNVIAYKKDRITKIISRNKLGVEQKFSAFGLHAAAVANTMIRPGILHEKTLKVISSPLWDYAWTPGAMEFSFAFLITQKTWKCQNVTQHLAFKISLGNYGEMWNLQRVMSGNVMLFCSALWTKFSK